MNSIACVRWVGMSSDQVKTTLRRSHSVSKAPLGLRAKNKLDRQLYARLQVAQLQAEKCDLKESRKTFLEVLKNAKKSNRMQLVMESVSGLLRLAVEGLDEAEIKNWDEALDQWMEAYPDEIPAMTWYCKAAVARQRGLLLLAQRYVLRYLRISRERSELQEEWVRGWVMLAILLQQRGRLQRSEFLCRALLSRFEALNYRGMNGILYLLLGTLFERKKDLKNALKWFQKAHGQFLAEHNWYYHLYVLFGYARLARVERNYARAYWYLDLVEKASHTPELGLLRREIIAEKTRLENDAIDLLIDSRNGVISTREVGQVSLGKQYVLLHILEALSSAHQRQGSDQQRGLSKAEIIETVWKEKYQPHIHDNKLYYNINRLRRLIEPNVHKPQYLLNCKEGYRLAPGLKIQRVEN